MRRTLLAASVLGLFAGPAFAQSENDDDVIVVEGTRGKGITQVISRLRHMIDEGDFGQLARYEDDICPVVIGLPADFTAIMTRMINENIIAAGGKLAADGCDDNAAVIFIDEPRRFVRALYKERPRFFHGMTPRTFDYFSKPQRPVYSWHLTNNYTPEGIPVGQKVHVCSATRLYTPIKVHLEAGMVVIDRRKVIGKTLRQMADFATMHLLVEVNWRSPRMDETSILALFQSEIESPQRLSEFDRHALRGFYIQRENNLTALMQQQNIATAIRKQERGIVVGRLPKYDVARDEPRRSGSE